LWRLFSSTISATARAEYLDAVLAGQERCIADERFKACR
jgi:hypothetical protein